MNANLHSIILEHMPALKRYCSSLCNHHKENTEDLIQNTIFKALSSGLRHDHNVRGFLFRIAKNERINHHRWNHFYPDSEPYMKDLAARESYDVNLHDLDAYNRMICQLKTHYGKALKMYMDGFQYKEIAEIQQVSINTVKTRIFLARKTLWRIINE